MKNFTSFLESRDEDLWWYHFDVILEKTEDEIANIQVKDGKWINLNSGPAQFQFNVEGDDNCSLERCYAVNISGDDHDPFHGVSIAFTRDNRYDDQRLGFGPKVFDGIRKAIFDYIKARNPASLSWSPIQRTSRPGEGKANTPEARKNAYEIWSLKALWPHLYVSFHENHWIRRDLYDKHFVPKGYPPVPEDIDKDTAPGIKRKALRAFREEAAKHSGSPKESEVHQSLSQEAGRARQEERERRRRQEEERLRDMMNNPQQNPHGLKVNDEVHIEDINDLNSDSDYQSAFSSSETAALLNAYRRGDTGGKIEEISVYYNMLVGRLEMGGRQYLLPLRLLKKDTSEGKQQREQRRKEFIEGKLADPSINPQGYKKGDKVIFSGQNSFAGAVAEITDIQYDSYWNEIKVDLKFLPDEALLDSARSLVDPMTGVAGNSSSMVKYTPENVEKFKADIERKKREEAETVFNPRYNPLMLKDGDKVIVDAGDLRGAVARVTDIKYRDGHLVATMVWIPEECTAFARRNLPGRSQQIPLTRPFLKKYSPEAIEQLRLQYDNEARRQQATATRAATMNTQGHDQGDRVRVTAGPMRNTIGNIDNFRVRNNRTYAILNTPRGPVEVDVALLSPDDMDF